MVAIIVSVEMPTAIRSATIAEIQNRQTAWKVGTGAEI